MESEITVDKMCYLISFFAFSSVPETGKGVSGSDDNNSSSSSSVSYCNGDLQRCGQSA
jgi:hypothetical protein